MFAWIAAALAAGMLAGLLVARRRPRRFPRPWRALLDARVPFYRRLDPPLKAEFERNVASFIEHNRFTGLGIDVTDEIKLIAAASAATLLIGRTDRAFPRIREVIFCPGPFDHERRTDTDRPKAVGRVSPDGIVTFSAPDLLRGMADARDGVNVGLHEFAHLLDKSGAAFDGLPFDFHPTLVRAWSDVMRMEKQSARRGLSTLDAYATTNRVEFFAVAVESYFEEPDELKRRSPELHALLAAYFKASD